MVTEASLKLACEMPVEPKRAHLLGIDYLTCYLRLTASGQPIVARVAEFVQNLAEGTTIPVVLAMNSFVDLDQVQASCGDSIERIANNDAVITTQPNSLARAVECWRSEALVIMFTERQSVSKVLASVSATKVPWWRFQDSSWEARYLRQMPLCDPVVFFAESHNSFEFFGTSRTVWTAVLAARHDLFGFDSFTTVPS